MIALWNRIPPIIRGPVTGIVIQMVGVMPLFMLVQKNIDILPNFPWALLIGSVYLLFFWKFLSGQRLIFPSSATRVDLSRTNKIAPKPTGLIVLTGVFLSITLFAFVFLGYLLAKVPLQQVELLTALKAIPLWTSLSLLFIASLATGVIEELAWRGYMQRILEKKYRPILAISLVALAFTIIHFLPLPVWPLFFLGSLGWGFFAYYSNSIIPGIICHTLIDLTAFIWAMFNLDTLQDILEYNVFEDGINSLFMILAGISIISVMITIIFLTRLKKHSSPPSDFETN